ncbi:MAG: hypothetical protein WBL95_12120 [Microcoleus sp.]
MTSTTPTLESFTTPIRLPFYGVDVQAIVASLADVGLRPFNLPAG